jgi:hypothetical protein
VPVAVALLSSFYNGVKPAAGEVHVAARERHVPYLAVESGRGAGADEVYYGPGVTVIRIKSYDWAVSERLSPTPSRPGLVSLQYYVAVQVSLVASGPPAGYLCPAPDDDDEVLGLSSRVSAVRVSSEC